MEPKVLFCFPTSTVMCPHTCAGTHVNTLTNTGMYVYTHTPTSLPFSLFHRSQKLINRKEPRSHRMSKSILGTSHGMSTRNLFPCPEILRLVIVCSLPWYEEYYTRTLSFTVLSYHEAGSGCFRSVRPHPLCYLVSPYHNCSLDVT